MRVATINPASEGNGVRGDQRVQAVPKKDSSQESWAERTPVVCGVLSTPTRHAKPLLRTLPREAREHSGGEARDLESEPELGVILSQKIFELAEHHHGVRSLWHGRDAGGIVKRGRKKHVSRLPPDVWAHEAS